MPERGPHKFSEGNDLDFHFDESWAICSPWDKEPAYKELDKLSKGVKGVDFLGVRAGPKEKLYLIEVKYYLGSERDPKTQGRLANGGAELLDIVAAKVRDTVMGLKRRCRWFTTDVAVRFLGGQDIPGLEVRSRAGARGTRGRRP